MNAPHRDDGFFTETLASRDPEIFGAIEKELGRQRDEIELIASENIVSAAVMEAQGSVMTNKYAEGYPGRRYYGGCQYVDIAENLAIERAKQAVRLRLRQRAAQFRQPGQPGRVPALLQPGDTILGMSLDAGGHLTHGAKPNQSGKWFNAIQYGVRRRTTCSTTTRSRRWRRAQAQDDHRRRLGHSAPDRLREDARDRRQVGAYLLWTWRISRGWWRRAITPRPSRTPTWPPPRRTRRCAARAAA
jgi:hypothetical protein